MGSSAVPTLEMSSGILISIKSVHQELNGMGKIFMALFSFPLWTVSLDKPTCVPVCNAGQCSCAVVRADALQQIILVLNQAWTQA